MAKVNFMASTRRLPVKTDVGGGREREEDLRILSCSYKLADDEGIVIGIKDSDLFQLVCQCSF